MVVSVFLGLCARRCCFLLVQTCEIILATSKCNQRGRKSSKNSSTSRNTFSFQPSG